jgi:hypothetical protein
VRFELGTARQLGQVTLDLFDVRGRRVRRLAFDTAIDEVAWDGRILDGQTALPGVYFYTLRVDGMESSGRLEVIQ